MSEGVRDTGGPAGDAIAALALAAVVVLRTIPFLVYAPFHFDSDQAVFGLMAIDLAHLRAVPIVMYGQSYMLGVISWLAAPLFAAFGPSVWLLKAPLVPVNVACAVVLFRLLRRSAGLTRWTAMLAAATLAVPTVVIAAAFVAASGGHVEPVLYVFLLYWFRHRPLVLPLFAAFAIAHREYVAAAVVALAIVDALQSSDRRELVRRWLGFGALCGLSIFLIRFAARHFSTNYAASDSLYKLTGSPAEGLSWLWTHASIVLGMRAADIRGLGVPISHVEGSLAAGAAVAALTVLALPAVLRVLRTRPLAEDAAFPLFLLTTCAVTSAAFVFRQSDHDPHLVRYLYLLVLLPASLGAICLQRYRTPLPRATAIGALSVLLALNVESNIRYWRELSTARMVDADREIVTVLMDRGFRYGLAPYWTAYTLAFRSGGLLHVSSNEVERIPQYQREYRGHPLEGFRIGGGPCAGQSLRLRDVEVCLFEPVAPVR